jgi:DNA-binding NarL/FixJ family response regulator
MKILVLDDHALIREALRGVIKELKDDAAVTEASDCRQAMSLVAAHSDLNLILLDLNLPDGNGFELLADLRKRYPAISIVVLSAFNDRANVIKALDLGAIGFIPKSSSREVMVNALRLIFSGGMYIPPDILSRPQTPGEQSASHRRTPDAARLSAAELGLTDRQMDVLALMMQGKSNKVICRLLNLAETTVKNHVSAILKALKVSNRTEAVIAAAEVQSDFRSASDRSTKEPKG